VVEPLTTRQRRGPGLAKGSRRSDTGAVTSKPSLARPREGRGPAMMQGSERRGPGWIPGTTRNTLSAAQRIPIASPGAFPGSLAPTTQHRSHPYPADQAHHRHRRIASGRPPNCGKTARRLRNIVMRCIKGLKQCGTSPPGTTRARPYTWPRSTPRGSSSGQPAGAEEAPLPPIGSHPCADARHALMPAPARGGHAAAAMTRSDIAAGGSGRRSRGRTRLLLASGGPH
jgi:hypothetical protein